MAQFATASGELPKSHCKPSSEFSCPYAHQAEIDVAGGGGGEGVGGGGGGGWPSWLPIWMARGVPHALAKFNRSEGTPFDRMFACLCPPAQSPLRYLLGGAIAGL